MGKKKNRIELFVYDPDHEEDESFTLEPSQQRLRLRMEKKNRGGKMVTVIAGFEGDGIEDLTKKLKTTCGVGGTAKDGDIILQGDVRNKAKEALIKWGFQDTKG